MMLKLYSKPGPNLNTAKGIKAGEAYHTKKFDVNVDSIRLVVVDVALQLEE